MPKRSANPKDIPALSILDPITFRAIEKLARDALSFSNNHGNVRSTISGLIVTLAQQANERHGFDTPDIVALKALLDRTDPLSPMNNARDRSPRHPLVVLEEQRLLDADQLAAAKTIEEIWRAFGRFLSVSARSYDGGGGKRTKILSPLEVMGESIHESWRQYYIPWIDRARQHKINGDQRRYNATTNGARVCLDIIVEAEPPYQIDNRFSLSEGTALTILQTQLTAFWGKP